MSIAPSVQAVVRELDATLPVANLATMNDVLRDSMARPRFFTLLLVVFALVALSLAAIGTYGVMAYSVTERRQEIGIRMALGAQAANVLGMVLVQGFGAAALGLVLGFAGALGLSGLLQSMLFTVSPTDPAAFITALLVLGAVALLACFIPARRATRVDPARVLKQE